jgi:hypothetical protein
MTIQGQLAISQKTSEPPNFGQLMPPFEGLLGNQSIQTPPTEPTRSIQFSPQPMHNPFAIFPRSPAAVAAMGGDQEGSWWASGQIAGSLSSTIGKLSVAFFGTKEEGTHFQLQNAGVVLNVAHADIRPENRLQHDLANTESPAMTWLVQNSVELGRFKGEWLLIQGQELLLHSRDFTAIRREIGRRRIAAPFVYYVPTDEESNSVTI